MTGESGGAPSVEDLADKIRNTVVSCGTIADWYSGLWQFIGKLSTRLEASSWSSAVMFTMHLAPQYSVRSSLAPVC